MKENNRTLAQLARQESAIIIGFTDDVIAMKLISMGVLPQAQVVLVRKAPFGKTFYIKVQDRQVMAIRKEEAKHIQIA